jgi:hypothetical protein
VTISPSQLDAIGAIAKLVTLFITPAAVAVIPELFANLSNTTTQGHQELFFYAIPIPSI